ncbi:hypothetical protein SPRG_10157 [Saprolegnia parasitica CBS 223.65]|uniref:START domain-containing protein n=1 Tax=Saprolegnia parasitica (strain CBS 223.65) TaxID=695850 RepID=A0A067C648_SAPPC|nr:hypothetical protein SPRG_10157 [Saprolegnia parasitica CBS 223.65]KDO24625.1 hypothetical protein SPRG_10157 [Saprolegnia parasitica CBS 223.65]|eukprot:XP_012204693.1 hypothetical protein SPRG_10157 [Saprolegnia parasitica CBS 223.65]
MTPLNTSTEARTEILAAAADGLNALIHWSSLVGAVAPTTANDTAEVCRLELDLGAAGAFDDAARLYELPNDPAAVLHGLHVDKSQPLYQFQADGMAISLRWGVFKAPLPFMRDRCATYIECTKEFTEASGRRGFARYLQSHATGALHGSNVPVDIRSWGVVLLETSNPSVLHVSSRVDIDWSSHTPNWVATMMTSRRAQSVKQLPSALRLAKKLTQARCAICLNKPFFLSRESQLAPCCDCARRVCCNCRALGAGDDQATSCWACVSAKAKRHAHRPHSKSIAMLEDAPQTCRRKTPVSSIKTPAWFTPQNHRRQKEPPVDLSYLPPL